MKTKVLFLKSGKVRVIYDSIEDYGVTANLLEACEYAFENLSPKGNIRKDFSGHNAKAVLSKAIYKAKQ